MKTPIRRILAASAALLLPCFAQAGTDITTSNFVPGLFSATAGYANNVPGSVCFAAGQTIFVQGSYNTGLGFNSVVNTNATACLAVGGAHTLSGNFNSAFGIFNSSGGNAFASLTFGQNNSVGGTVSLVGGNRNVSTSTQSLIYGSFLNDGGQNGSVMLSDGNPFGLRTTAAPFTNVTPHTFNGSFNGGYFMFTDDGQPSAVTAGLFIVPTPANTAGAANPAFVGINNIAPTQALDVVGNATFTNNVNASSFTGDGSGLSNLNASALTFGTVSDARLSANVALLGSANLFTQDQTISKPGAAKFIATCTGPSDAGVNAFSLGQGWFTGAASDQDFRVADLNANKNFINCDDNQSGTQTWVGFCGQINANAPIHVGNSGDTVNGNGAFCSSTGVWTNASSRTFKENFQPVDTLAILKKVSELPVRTYTYKGVPEVTHMGPVAEDFKDMFGLGENEKYIASLDTDGVALAAIQGLNEVVKDKDKKIQELEERLSRLEKLLEVAK